jgi:predicted exporter
LFSKIPTALVRAAAQAVPDAVVLTPAAKADGADPQQAQPEAVEQLAARATAESRGTSLAQPAKAAKAAVRAVKGPFQAQAASLPMCTAG